MKRFIMSSFLVLLILISAGLFVTNNSIQNQASGQIIQDNLMGQRLSKIGFSIFDINLAIELMDKNKDGKCDACGMPVEMCIDTGQMECNMDPKSTIGVLGSQHIHANWKIYLNGGAFDFSGLDHMTRMQQGLSVSSFIHVDSGAPQPEKTGDVLHMHATGVPLWIFFKSVEMELPENIKMYVNGEEVSDWKNYVFADLDKVLLTDGVGDLQEQLNSITSFAGSH